MMSDESLKKRIYDNLETVFYGFKKIDKNEQSLTKILNDAECDDIDWIEFLMLIEEDNQLELEHLDCFKYNETQITIDEFIELIKKDKKDVVLSS